MHIPKSGGSSIHEALRAVIPLNQNIGTVDAVPTRRAASLFYSNIDDEQLVHEDGFRCKELFDLREYQLLTHMAHNDALIYGHILFSKKADDIFSGMYKYITILRDPVKRVISNYRSATYEKFYRGSLDEYLESDVARRHALLNVRYFSGRAEISSGEECIALQEAITNLEKFSVVGFLDRLDQFCGQFQDVFGRRPVIHHYNSSKSEEVSPTPEQLNKIVKLCSVDIELDQKAKTIFHYKNE